MKVLRVGCPMWAHRPWVGRFYPVGTKPGTELGLYASWCNAVEGNTTFYAEPSAGTVAKWTEQTPADFRFAFKLPRTVTHDKRLRDVATEVRSFLQAIDPLGDRVGPLQVQLPATFGPDRLDVLLAFLRRLPLDRSWALELRHPAFFDDSATHRRVDGLCIERGITRIMLDSRPLHLVPAASDAAREEKQNKPDLPVLTQVAGDHPIVRVIGQDRPEGTMDGLLAWVPQVVTWLDEGRVPYVFVHQPENLDSPGLARAFHDAVADEVPDLEPLPDPAGQTTMF
ncbi:MAG: DUF72 domain-containing protein [Ilumatobacter sp.]|uniref:DUF72 domain-containing protein n=1 Tax=Ilumatobacter sp. TaxID=1967498 RepID=UPI003C70C545